MDIESIEEVEEAKLEYSIVVSRADSVNKVDKGDEHEINRNPVGNPKLKSESGLSMVSSANDSVSEASPEPRRNQSGFPSEV